jgi:NIPSNAP
MVGSNPIVELRQYRLWPGRRDVLIELFDREFVESQEAVGMQVIGQFRDLDRPDHFVWIRGFADMERRRQGLEAFYGGPVWKAHREVANATMIDSDDVLLLRALPTTSGLDPLPPRPAPGAQIPASIVGVTILSLDGPVDVSVVERELLPALATTSSPPLATFIEEASENTFPALPVRTGEHVLVLIQRVSRHQSQEAQLRASSDIARDLLPTLIAAPVQRRLEPTPRSRLR